MQTKEKIIWPPFWNKVYDRNQVADQRFSLKHWFAAGAHSCRPRKAGPAHCYIRISELQRV